VKVGYVIALVCGMLAGQLLFAALHRDRDYIVVLTYRAGGNVVQTSAGIKARDVTLAIVEEVQAKYRAKSDDGNVVVLNVIKLDE